MTGKSVAHCASCSNIHETPVYETINTDIDPELKASVLDGSLFVWECPHCGAHNLARYRTLYHDPASKLMLWITFGDDALENEIRESYSKLPELKDYTARFVDDAGSLIEKVKIFDSGLDDLAMELCKFVTARDLGVQATDLKFFRADGVDGEITFSYPKDGQMQLAAVGFHTYEDCCAILSRHPDIKEKATGFVKIDARWLSAFIG